RVRPRTRPAVQGRLGRRPADRLRPSPARTGRHAAGAASPPQGRSAGDARRGRRDPVGRLPDRAGGRPARRRRRHRLPRPGRVPAAAGHRGTRRGAEGGPPRRRSGDRPSAGAPDRRGPDGSPVQGVRRVLAALAGRAGLRVVTPVTHPLLDRAGVRHGFFTRQGGVSAGLYDSLNTGVGSQDEPVAVAENRRRVAAWFGGGPDDLAACYQIHSAVAHVAEAGWKGERPEGDASVTAAAGVICAVLTADCAPVLLADPEAGVVGAAHAGWKGALGGIVHSTVAAMEALGARPDRMVAVVGPCIAQSSYEV